MCAMLIVFIAVMIADCIRTGRQVEHACQYAEARASIERKEMADILGKREGVVENDLR